MFSAKAFLLKFELNNKDVDKIVIEWTEDYVGRPNDERSEPLDDDIYLRIMRLE